MPKIYVYFAEQQFIVALLMAMSADLSVRNQHSKFKLLNFQSCNFSTIVILSGSDFAMTGMMTHFEVLGVSPSATAAELKSAFRRKALACHPDKNIDRQDAET